MKYSLRKSFHTPRRIELHDDDHVYPRLDANGCSNSNSNLVKTKKKKKNFLQRRRRFSSSPPPPSPPPVPISTSTNFNKSKSKKNESGYTSHVNDDNEEDDDPFSPSITNNRTRPLDRLTHQLRKSFRNTLTRQRPRLESNNSNKRLIFKNNETSNQLVEPIVSPTSTGLSSQIIAPNEPNQNKTSIKRRKAPLAPSHIHQSQSVPNVEYPTLHINENHESGYGSSPNEQEKTLMTNKKTKLNRSFRSRLSLLLKKRHEKQQQIPTCIDEESDVQNHDEHDEIEKKKSTTPTTLGQRFDTIRRSLHLGKRNSSKQGKGHLLLSE